MQALIDFDGWRKWKDFGISNGETTKAKPAIGAPSSNGNPAANGISAVNGKSPVIGPNESKDKREREKARREKRSSMDVNGLAAASSSGSRKTSLEQTVDVDGA